MSWEQESVDEFIAVYNSFPKIVEDPIEYRMHYDENGVITMLSHQNHPKDTNYIVVTQDEYADYQHYCVDVDAKKLKKIAHNIGLSVQLKKSNQGYPVTKNHAGVLLEPGDTYTNIDHYEHTNR